MNYQEKCIKWTAEMAALMNTKAFEAMCGDIWFPNKYEREYFIIIANFCEEKTDLLYNELTKRPLPVEDVKARMEAWQKLMVPVIESLKNFKP